jgi:hypothetical protein
MMPTDPLALQMRLHGVQSTPHNLLHPDHARARVRRFYSNLSNPFGKSGHGRHQ